MTDSRYRKNRGCIYSLKYHLVWCPKYRRSVLVGDIARDLGVLLRDKADRLGIDVEALEIMPDHVHIFVSADPTDAPQRIANQFKGYTSRVLRDRYPDLLKMPSLWSRSYYVGSVGFVSDSTVKKYIANQRGK